MSAPQYVPTLPAVPVRSYASPPRRPESWTTDRPGDLVGDGVVDRAGQPHGDRLGSPGPDPGYVYTMLGRFRSKVHLGSGERWKDAAAGAAAVALKRASLFGRAPVVHDLTVAFGVWGFLDEDPDGELLALRRNAFAEVSHPADYMRLRQVVDAVPAATLCLRHQDALAAHARDWRGLLQLDELASSDGH